MPNPFERPPPRIEPIACNECKGVGQVTDPKTGKYKTCPKCNGSGHK